ncbi:MAG: efflux pump, family, rane fusion lipoprotein, partial [Cyanobacteria bacterium RYN_339]|nr:efflux pump, family, rane fusion lipoprotein [Cyanobacteria bacterium RYN_339]
DAVQAANARREAGRYAGLAAQGFVAREQAEQFRATSGALEATLAADRATVQNAKIQLSYASIYAPIDGVVGALSITAGNLVRANDTAPLVTINQIHPVYVNFALPEADIGRVREHMASKKLGVVAQPKGGAPADGELAFLDNAVDVATGTLHMKAVFPNATNNLMPGQFTDVRLTLNVDPNAITVPAQAVLTGQQGTYAYVLNADDTVAVRPVKVERQSGTLAVVKEGLKPGERVVTDGQLQLVDGAKVRLRQDLRPPAGAVGKPGGAKRSRVKGAKPDAGASE